MDPIFDKIGQEITEGCYIAYGHALGRCAGLRVGKVLKVARREQERFDRREPGYSITVWGVSDDWRPARPCLLSKKSTLFFPDRMIVLHYLPEQLEQLLGDVTIDTKLVPCKAPVEGRYHFDCEICCGTGKVKGE